MSQYTMPALPKTRREFRRMHLIVPDMTSAGGSEVTYVLGRDTDDMSREYGWEEEDQLNVLGEATSTNKITSQSISADPFYARRGDPMSLFLYHLDETRADLDSIKATYAEVVVDLDEGEVIYAFMQEAYVLIQSVGGPAADADSMPFNIKLTGKPRKADYDIATGEFTEV